MRLRRLFCLKFPLRTAAFLEEWLRSNEFMSVQPGLIEGTLYKASLDNTRYRFVNVARWESQTRLNEARERHARELGAKGLDQKATWASLGVKVTPLSYAPAVIYAGPKT